MEMSVNASENLKQRSGVYTVHVNMQCFFRSQCQGAQGAGHRYSVLYLSGIRWPEWDQYIIFISSMSVVSRVGLAT